jgi:hypothetical protein
MVRKPPTMIFRTNVVAVYGALDTKAPYIWGDNNNSSILARSRQGD